LEEKMKGGSKEKNLVAQEPDGGMNHLMYTARYNVPTCLALIDLAAGSVRLMAE
jgi:hypothetical protein